MTNCPNGQLCIAGLGPGDPELLTLKALRALERADYIFAPCPSATRPSLAASIITAANPALEGKIIKLVFPMSANPSELALAWQEAEETIAGYLLQGHNCVFATEGDPLLYGTFSYISPRLAGRINEPPFKYIPGISSPFAAASATGLPLTLGEDKLAILPATCGIEQIEQALGSFEAVALLKVSAIYPRIISLLKEKGLLGKCSLVCHASSPQQQIISGEEALKNICPPYFSILLIRSKKDE
ncbi:MAG: precorrin-2 C(20)-methyltransferase [Dehalococcoides mccartyi]|uniref:precorrin-2 C(20)-methyltransferase n=1 Tax=Dehalococcoides mccartyi TaxID=61435 RepID=UPI0030FAF949